MDHTLLKYGNQVDPAFSEQMIDKLNTTPQLLFPRKRPNSLVHMVTETHTTSFEKPALLLSELSSSFKRCKHAHTESSIKEELDAFILCKEVEETVNDSVVRPNSNEGMAPSLLEQHSTCLVDYSPSPAAFSNEHISTSETVYEEFDALEIIRTNSYSQLPYRDEHNVGCPETSASICKPLEIPVDHNTFDIIRHDDAHNNGTATGAEVDVVPSEVSIHGEDLSADNVSRLHLQCTDERPDTQMNTQEEVAHINKQAPVPCVQTKTPCIEKSSTRASAPDANVYYTDGVYPIPNITHEVTCIKKSDTQGSAHRATMHTDVLDLTPCIQDAVTYVLRSDTQVNIQGESSRDGLTWSHPLPYLDSDVTSCEKPRECIQAEGIHHNRLDPESCMQEETPLITRQDVNANICDELVHTDGPVQTVYVQDASTCLPDGLSSVTAIAPSFQCAFSSINLPCAPNISTVDSNQTVSRCEMDQQVTSQDVSDCLSESKTLPIISDMKQQSLTRCTGAQVTATPYDHSQRAIDDKNEGMTACMQQGEKDVAELHPKVSCNYEYCSKSDSLASCPDDEENIESTEDVDKELLFYGSIYKASLGIAEHMSAACWRILRSAEQAEMLLQDKNLVCEIISGTAILLNALLSDAEAVSRAVGFQMIVNVLGTVANLTASSMARRQLVVLIQSREHQLLTTIMDILLTSMDSQLQSLLLIILINLSIDTTAFTLISNLPQVAQLGRQLGSGRGTDGVRKLCGELFTVLKESNSTTFGINRPGPESDMFCKTDSDETNETLSGLSETQPGNCLYAAED